MKPDREIVVGLDGSAGSTEAVDWATAFAATHLRPLHLVHALHDPADRSDGGRILDRDAADQHLAAAAHRAADRGVPAVRQTIADRAAAPLLVEIAESAALLVVGSRGGGARLWQRGDSVGAHVSRFARCPVVVVPPTVNHPTGMIAVNVRGEPGDRRCLDFAFDQAAATHCEVEVVHAWQEPESGPTTFSPLFQGEVEKHRRASEILVSEELAGFATTHPDVRVQRVSTPAEPRDALLWSSAQADLLVVAAPNPGEDVRAAQLLELAALRHAHCPVVFAR